MFTEDLLLSGTLVVKNLFTVISQFESLAQISFVDREHVGFFTV